MREQTTLRLTIRLPEELDRLIRDAAKCKGLSINQMMLSILNKYLQSRDKEIWPCCDS